MIGYCEAVWQNASDVATRAGGLKAYSGREGLALMRYQRPDVVVLDVIMPDVDGLTILQIMQNDRCSAISSDHRFCKWCCRGHCTRSKR